MRRYNGPPSGSISRGPSWLGVICRERFVLMRLNSEPLLDARVRVPGGTFSNRTLMSAAPSTLVAPPAFKAIDGRGECPLTDGLRRACRRALKLKQHIDIAHARHADAKHGATRGFGQGKKLARPHDIMPLVLCEPLPAAQLAGDRVRKLLRSTALLHGCEALHNGPEANRARFYYGRRAWR
jgi:hypothetical protein